MCNNGTYRQQHDGRVMHCRQHACGMGYWSRHEQGRRYEQGPPYLEEQIMYSAPIVQLRSSPAALAAILGPLRAEVLATLWRLGRATARDVHGHLHAPRRRTYGTVRAAMQRLAADGYLTRLPRKERNAYVYVPGVSQEALTLQILHQILDGLTAAHPAAVAAYVARYDTARAPRLRLVWVADRQRKHACS
jgi:predicted transcriptional regulator